MRKNKTPATNDSVVKVNIKMHKDNKGGHPHIIMEDIEDKHLSIGLTTKEKKGKNHPNIKLELDPLNSGKTSYMRREGTIDPKSRYFGKRVGNITENDYEKAVKIGEKTKKKYKKK